MYAIINSGGRQLRVEKGATVEVDQLDANIGDVITLGQVVMVGGETVTAGTDALKGASVSAKVLGHLRGKKVIGLRYKPKKHFRRRVGNRMNLTRVQVTEITVA